MAVPGQPGDEQRIVAGGRCRGEYVDGFVQMPVANRRDRRRRAGPPAPRARLNNMITCYRRPLLEKVSLTLGNSIARLTCERLITALPYEDGPS